MSQFNKPYEQVRWACRRGMLECDLFLVPFFEQSYQSLSDDEKEAFQKLLEEPDPVLMSWFLGDEKPQESFMLSLVKRIQKAPLKV